MSKRLLIFLLTLTCEAQAKPENIRKGYPSCAICHANPNGGGTPTAYGRMASEGMSTWYNETEASSGWGLFASDSTLLGADIRTLSTGDSQFLMQAEAEAVLAFDYLTLSAKGGVYGQNQGSRSHYVMVGSDGFFLRAGKLNIPYGLQIEDHSAFIKATNALGPGSEGYGAEAQYEMKYGKALLGVYDQRGLLRLEGWLSHYELAVSLLYDTVSQTILYGLSSMLAPSESYYLFMEVSNAANPLTYDNLLTAYMRGGFYITSGVEFRLTRGFKSDYQGEEQSSFTGGLNLIPRPHWELLIEYGIAKDRRGVKPLYIVMAHWWL